MFVFVWFIFSKWKMALRDTQGRYKPSTNCFRTGIHRLNARMEADYENTYDSPRQEQFSGTRYSVRWPRLFKLKRQKNIDKYVRRWILGTNIYRIFYRKSAAVIELKRFLFFNTASNSVKRQLNWITFQLSVLLKWIFTLKPTGLSTSLL